MWLNQMCEAQLQWYYDNGIFYINGRDVVCLICGTCLGILIMLIDMLINYIINERRINK